MAGENLKIPIDKIRADMILATDVITKSGSVLLKSGTLLNNVNISKMRTLGIEYVEILTDDGIKPKKKRPAVYHKSGKMTPVVKRVEFLEFEQEYEARAAEYELAVKEIGAGQNIDVNRLYKITGGVLESTEFKSDILTFVNSLKATDDHTFSHSINVSVLCHIFAQWLGLSQKDKVELTVAGLLHDIGKTKITREILNKKDKLTDDEWSRIKAHSAEGYQILRNQKVSYEIKMAVLMHHEKMDGSGYPMGVLGDKIAAFARIVSICDMYDAMTADRPWRKKMCPFVAMRIMETGLYPELDIPYLMVFLKNIAYNYLGAWVSLTDGRSAEVMFINKNTLSKPIVRTEAGDLIDLASSEELQISALL